MINLHSRQLIVSELSGILGQDHTKRRVDNSVFVWTQTAHFEEVEVEFEFNSLRIKTALGVTNKGDVMARLSDLADFYGLHLIMYSKSIPTFQPEPSDPDDYVEYMKSQYESDESDEDREAIDRELDDFFNHL